MLRYFVLGNTLELHQDLKKWQVQVAKADKLFAGAKALLKQDTGNPLETQNILEALSLCNGASKILHDEQILQVIKQCQTQLKKREDFQKLITEADSCFKNRFFQNAINIYRQAKQLYSTEAVNQSITTCELQVHQEQKYYSALNEAREASNQGRLRGAIALLQSALNKFPRQDGIELLEQLQRAVKGKEKYRLGLQAEKAGKFGEAISFYKSAQVLLPDFIDCKMRLSVVAIKTQEWATAILQLTDIEVEQAKYLRGFAHLKQGQLQSAHREWQNIQSTPSLLQQKQNLKIISQRQKLQALKNIEQSLASEHLEQAQTLSREYLQKYGSDAVVESNLNDHILPRLKAAIWRTDSSSIVEAAVKLWVNEPNITNLHNWVVATYYRVFANFSTTCVDDLIIALPTAIANLNQDLALQNIPWLNNTVDLESISLELKRRLEEIIDKFKDISIEQYLSFRDKYRLEIVALRLMGNPLFTGMKVQELFITPGCYNRFYAQWQNILVEYIDSKQNILRTLYTSWGLAVAACIEGDVLRAIQIKPSNQSNISKTEFFAKQFIAYHEGCHYLKQQKWRQAINHLDTAKTEIQASRDWQNEIDKLCTFQRQAISEFQEHLEFAQFWYNLLSSNQAKSYLAEYKAEELRQKLVNNKISPDQALNELKKIQQIDQENPIVLDFIERLEVMKELEEVKKLFERGMYEAVVKKARNSRYDHVRFTVAELFIEILINAAQRGNPNDYELVQQLGRWAYDICPNEPAFEEIYRSLKLIY